MIPKAAVFSPRELQTGLCREFTRQISAEDVLAFAALSGDHNPLHVDEQYAAGTNYKGRIAHGAFLVGLASCMIGMHLPGQHVLLGSVNARFLAPLYFPTTVRVHGEVTSWNLGSMSGRLRVLITDVAHETLVADVTMGFTMHISSEDGLVPNAQDNTGERKLSSHKKVLLVTGAAGGVGLELVKSLAETYHILALVNTSVLPDAVAQLDTVTQVSCDLLDPLWAQQVADILKEGPLYGVIHAAWPGAPKGGLLDVGDNTLNRQVLFGSQVTISLLRFLCRHVDTGTGGRFIAMSSIVGTSKPVLALAPYALGKAVLEHTVSLLAPEVARKGITANTICPAFIPAGINKHLTERQLLMEAARSPMNRLCTIDDILHTVRFLLAKESSYLSGEHLVLSGGQL